MPNSSRQLRHDFKHTPEWSHDGQYVAFDALPEFDAIIQSKIFVVAVNGPFKGKVLDLGCGNTPAWSPDDRQIAYMINPGNPIGVLGGVWIMTADGNHRERVADGFYPRWSPDGKQICVHALLNDGRPSLILIDAETHQAPLALAAGLEAQLLRRQLDCRRKAGGLRRHARRPRPSRLDRGQRPENPIRILYTNPDPTLGADWPAGGFAHGKQIVFAQQPKEQQGPRQWWKSYLYSIPADASSEPKLLEGKEVGNINRGMSFSPDHSTVIFSSER